MNRIIGYLYDRFDGFVDMRNISILGLIFILSMGIALNPTILRYYELPYIFQVVITVFWIVYALLLFMRRLLSKSEIIGIEGSFLSNFSKLAKVFACPKLLIWLYGILLFVFGIGNPEYASTGYTQVASILLPLAALYVFQDEAVDYIYYACLCSFVPIVLLTCFVDGVDSLAAPLLSIVEPETVNPFENHQFTFTTSFLFIYYLCIDGKKDGKNIVPIIMTGIMTFMGFKRILVLSLGAVICVYLLLEHLNAQNKTRICRLINWIIIFICIGFVWLIYSEKFFTLMDQLNIQTMGRIYYYKVVVDNTSFSPSFLGLGLNAVSRMLTQDYAYLRVGGVHSDILKYYAEIGFVGFIIWLWVYLHTIPRFLEKNYGVDAVCAMCLVNILAFISYLTDNIDIYLGSQYLYVAIPITIAMRAVSKNHKEVIQNNE